MGQQFTKTPPRPMQQNAKVLSVNAVIVANGIFVPFVEKYRLKQASIFRRQRFQDGSDLLTDLFGQQLALHVFRSFVLVVRTAIPLRDAGLPANVFHQHVVTDGVYECSELSRVLQARPASQAPDDTNKNLLLQILDLLIASQAKLQFCAKQNGEVFRKVALCLRVSRYQTPQILFIESEQLS